MAEAKKVIRHKHYRMGQGDYRLVGFWEAPSRAVLEQNPMAYNNMMASAPESCRCFCHHCGTGIRLHFILEDELGDRYSVGSSCIDKLGQKELVTEAHAMKLERDRAKRKEAADRKREQQQEAREAKLQAQRDKNGGLTDYELKQKDRKDREEQNSLQYREISKPIKTLLRAAGGDFCKSIVSSLNDGKMPSGGGKVITIEIMAKQKSGARKNSKAYKAVYPEMEALFNDISSQINTIRENHLTYLRTNRM